MEGEQGECIGSTKGGDRDQLELPPNQVEFVRKLALPEEDRHRILYENARRLFRLPLPPGSAGA